MQEKYEQKVQKIAEAQMELLSEKLKLSCKKEILKAVLAERAKVMKEMEIEIARIIREMEEKAQVFTVFLHLPLDY